MANRNANHPNVILIPADDMGCGDLGRFNLNSDFLTSTENEMALL